ncbi:unnamed protein product [Closterium sp. Naga37s-1]|nr:unnamed protein product [Closterium sp. Naga37s-1]
MEEQGVVVRRVMDADNSCLFNAVGYVTERSRDKGAQLRQVIARVVAGDEQRFTEAVLDKPNAAYCQWIARADSWGGGIELAILSDHFAKKIAAFDIQTKRCDVYGQDKPYSETIMLIYDGIHYDALALSPCEGAPEDFDQTIFPATAAHPLPPAVRRSAEVLVEAAHKAKSFTDTARFALRCVVCQQGLMGQKVRVIAQCQLCTAHRSARYVQVHHIACCVGCICVG